MNRNVTASVRARLQNRAKDEGRPFQEMLQHYGLERFLFRLSRSPHRDKFILKGALMLRVWGATASRPTRDIDFLGFTKNDLAEVEAIIVDVCDQGSVDDGVVFDSTTVKGERIKEEADYQGIRIKFVGLLERARIPMQIDIAFDDVVHPGATNADYPTLLGTPRPTLRAYPKEAVVAEKLQAMIHLGTLNSRMKDFYDIWILSRLFNFNGPVLLKAISMTFVNRHTTPEADPIAFKPVFYEDDNKAKQWAAFLRKSHIGGAPKSLADLIEQLRAFLAPILSALVAEEGFRFEWRASGPWSPIKS